MTTLTVKYEEWGGLLDVVDVGEDEWQPVVSFERWYSRFNPTSSFYGRSPDTQNHMCVASTAEGVPLRHRQAQGRAEGGVHEPNATQAAVR